MRSVPNWPNTAAMMFALARDWGRRPMLRAWQNGAWHGTDWDSFARKTAALARALRASGISAGDRVLLVSENRPDFLIAEVALQAIRAVPVPAYVTNTIADHAHILADSGATAAIVSTETLAAKITEAARLDLLICMQPGASSALDWTATLANAPDYADIAAEAAIIPPGALAVIIYTSGTGGAPRGVMLSHRAIIANCRSAYEFLRPLNAQNEIYLSFLPLSHAYEHTVGGFFLPITGTEIVYARGVEHLAADMLAVRPTIMTMVPRVLELIRSRMLATVAREPAWRQRLFQTAIEIGRKRIENHPLSFAERLADPILDRLVRQKIRARFGGRLRAAMSGGARLDPEVGRFFQSLGIILMQGYGQTEAGPVISAVSPTSRRIDTVGHPLQGVELRIATDGEILVRGDLVMDGYWRRPAETARTVIDNWLHTGDIGTIDPDGSLRITDRKKDLIVLSGGENISPARIEGRLAAQPAIHQAVVTGDGKSSLTALIVPTEGTTDAAITKAIAQVNQNLSPAERIKRHLTVPEFTLENGLLTATQKVRRHLVIETHRELL